MYLFSGSYMMCLGQFKAELVEQMWARLNALSGQINQMNTGHRHDTWSDHLGDWNWMKLVNLGRLDTALNIRRLTKVHCSIVSSRGIKLGT